MASLISILKNALTLNKMHVISCEEETVLVSRNLESFAQQRIIVHARPYKRLQSICPRCGRKCSGYDTKHPDVETTWRSSDINGVPVLIRYTPHRIQCPEHGVLTEQIPWADGDSRFTESFNNEVAWLAMHMSKTAVTDFIGINWRTVGNCIKAAWNRVEPDVTERLHGLKRICVDETGSRKGYEYITVVYDMDRNRVVWVAEGLGYSVFEQFCMLLTEEERAGIEVVAGDGARWIDSCVRDYFPNATRCIDFFHVVEWANEALDKVRTHTAAMARNEYATMKRQYFDEERQEEIAFRNATRAYHAALEELNSMPKRGRPSKRKKELEAMIAEYEQLAQYSWLDSTGYCYLHNTPLRQAHKQSLKEYEARTKDIKNSKFALGHRPENCTDSQREKLALIQNSYPDLYKAYQYKESLRLILHMKDYELATTELDNWISETLYCDVDAFRELSAKIERHRTNILNSVKFQANSAKSESTNTTIKALIKVARGFRNINNLFAFIYLKCSDLVIPINNRYQPTAEKSAELRAKNNDRRRAREQAKHEEYIRLHPELSLG